MAKKKAETDPFVDNLVAGLQTISGNDKINILANTSIYDIAGWTDTGILALNIMISNSFDRGVPDGRIVQLYGESQSGKSLILSYIGANAQKQGYIIVLIESEFGESKESMVGKGLDPKTLIPMPTKTLDGDEILDDKGQVKKIPSGKAKDVGLHKILLKVMEIKRKYPSRKIMVLLDSLGNLGSRYELQKLSEGKVDQGHRARLIRTIFKDVTIDLGNLGIPFIFTNHIYEGPDQMGRKAGGGHGAKYLPTVTIDFSKGSAITRGEKEKNTLETIGVVLHASTVKNRIAPAYRKIDLSLDFTHGFKKYSGLLPSAIQNGFLYMDKSRVCVPHLPKVKGDDNKPKDVSYFPAQLLDGEIADKVWTPILKDLEAKIIENNSYFSPDVQKQAVAEEQSLTKDDVIDEAETTKAEQ
jgi:recombination protein RecA